jgi:hypothetical protein
MAVKKTTKKSEKPSTTKKVAKKTAAPKASTSKAKAPALDLATLDRRGLSARARQLKLELLAIRFNLQSPSLKEYRNKRRELATVLAQLG